MKGHPGGERWRGDVTFREEMLPGQPDPWVRPLLGLRVPLHRGFPSGKLVSKRTEGGGVAGGNEGTHVILSELPDKSVGEDGVVVTWGGGSTQV